MLEREYCSPIASSKSEFNKYIYKFTNPNIVNIINRYGDIDYPSKLASPIIKINPSFLKLAKKILKKQGRSFVAQRTQRETREGIIESYLHPNKKIGVLVELNCESDFVAKSEDFQKLAHELCLQIAAMNPKKGSLLSQPWIKEETKTVKDLVSDYIVKMGENIVVKRFARYEI